MYSKTWYVKESIKYKIILILVIDDSLAIFATHRELVTELVPVLLKLSVKSSPSQTFILRSLTNLSLQGPIKNIICTKSVLNTIVQSLTSFKGQSHIILANLKVLRNCATTALGKAYIPSVNAFTPLSDLLSSIDQEIQAVTLDVIGLLMCLDKNRKKYLAMLIKEPILTLLKGKSRSIHNLACIAVGNIAVTNSNDMLAAVPSLLSFLSSSNMSLVNNALKALINFSSGIIKSFFFH